MKVVDVLLALTFALGGVRLASSLHPAAVLTGLLQVAMAVAFVARAPEVRAAPTVSLVAALPSLLLAGVVFSASHPEAWAWPSLALMSVGAVIALSALVSLGKSFAVLPGLRALQTRGAYALVRHPLYLGETLMFVAAAWQLGWVGVIAVLTLAPLLAWRISHEERVLRHSAAWADWAAKVRWRLLPFVW